MDTNIQNDVPAPCPWCGVIPYVSHGGFDYGDNYYQVTCPGVGQGKYCLAMGPQCSNEKDAIKEWNRVALNLIKSIVRWKQLQEAVLDYFKIDLILKEDPTKTNLDKYVDATKILAELAVKNE